MTVSAFRYPADGDVYEALEDVDTPFVTHWQAPFTGGGRGILPKGTRVRVLVLPSNPAAASFYARPVNYAAVEPLLVSGRDRASPTYDGFSLVISAAELDARFQLVQSRQP